MNMPMAQQIAVVAGDVTIDWYVATDQPPAGGQAAWTPEQWARACWQRGGAALLVDLLEAVADALRENGQADVSIRHAGAPRQPIHPGDRQFHHAYTLWSPFREGNRSVWRVHRFLGLDTSPTEGVSQAGPWGRVVDDAPEADLVVIDEASLGYRHRSDLWPQALTSPGREPWVVLKMTQPVACGPLWETLLERHADRLIVVTTVSDLRRTEVQISRGLSWERTAQDVAWELQYNPCVNALTRCAAVVVSFDTAGAVVLSRLHREDNQEPEQHGLTTRLFFDPTAIEGTWKEAHPGGMINYTTCLTAAIARQVMLDPQAPAIDQGVQSGLQAMRTLHLVGYGEPGALRRCQLAFPIDTIAAELGRQAAPLAAAEVQDPVRFLKQPAADEERPAQDGWWTILQDRYRDNLNLVAERVVREGADFALQDVPQGRFGHLLTVDRREIESFRSIHALAAEYLSKERHKRPLSIAVFGAPGSGKSFGITQVARSLAPGRIEVLEFNLSQLESPDELIDALHQVRDAGLSGQVPLVFWDEFDTTLAGRRLGWLRYFLAPMQDGHFRQGQVVHPIGHSIFVFAGGTSHHMEGFGRELTPDERRAAKVPDFVSRLKGYVNVLGPNPSQAADGAGFDPYYIIRRAILLRSILWRYAPHMFHEKDGRQTLHIDHGVLRAFLTISDYKHGVRSMESIVAMSQLSGRASYERSSLPAEAQLELHVDGQEFLALVHQMDLTGDLLEELARAHHEVFREQMEAVGYRPGATTDERAKTHSALRPYDELPEEEKEQNRDAVRDIPAKLAQSGYVMIPARSNEPPFEFPGPHIERLAQIEHERWMQVKRAMGWEYAPETDKERKRHQALVPWSELPEEQKEKDRALVRAIPRILSRIGYTVVQLRSERDIPSG
jgi:hypothetical protein